MYVAKIVINASPLVLLCNAELEFILPELFSEIIVPTAVWNEILAGPSEDRAAEHLPKLSWLTQQKVSPSPEIIRWDLGAGETEVLSFGVQQSDFTAVLDDGLAKKCAKTVSVPTLGTGSILILAKQQNLITSVEESLRKLQAVGLWISEPIIQMLKSKAEE